MKKIILCLIFIAISSTFFSCANQKQSVLNKEETKEEVKTYTLKLNSTFPTPKYDWEPKAVSVNNFAKRIEEATQGRIKIQVFYGNQLAPQAQALDALDKGVFDILNCSSHWGGKIPESDFIFMPFWSKGGEHAIHVMRETGVGKIFDEIHRKNGSHVLFYWPTSSQVIMSKKPIDKIDQLKGLRIRIGTPLWLSWYKRMGVAPINIAVAEQYEALMRGTLDATIYPFYAMDTYKLYEVCKYVTFPGFIDNMFCYNLINLKTWEMLPEDLRKIMEDVSIEIEKETVQASDRLTEYSMQEVVNKGVQIVKLNKEEFEKVKEIALPCWEEFAARTSQCKEMVELAQEDIKRWESANPELARQWEEKWLAK